MSSILHNLGDKKPNVVVEKISLTDDDGKKKSQSTLLIEVGQQGKLFHCSSGDAYTEIIQGSVTATLKVRSREYKEYLCHKLYKLTDKGANSNAIADAITTLEAEAKFNGKEVTIAVRSHHNVDSVFIDMGTKDRSIIEVKSTGWKSVNKAPIKFIRKNGMTELPEPKQGSIELLQKYINVSENEIPLIYGWMLCAIAGVKPYPILILQGEQGTGKSTTCKVIRSLVDPSAVPLRSPPKDTRDLLVSAANTHCIVLDNLSGISADLSDCLCRLSTGGGHDVRALFTDNEQYLIELQKPIMCNGIDDVATRPDLSERSLIINLPFITSSARKSESQFWTEFERDKSQILGALLNGVSSGLKHSSSITLKDKPRMVDVAIWVTACERELNLEGGFISAHTDNQAHAVELGIDASPIGNALMTLMTDRTEWSGKPTDLYNTLSDIAGERQARANAWPQSTKGLKNTITRLTPNFRKIGISICYGRMGNARYYKINNYGMQASYPSQVSQIKTDKGLSGDDYKTKASQVTDRNSKCHTLTPEITEVMMDVTVMTDKNDNNMKATDKETF